MMSKTAALFVGMVFRCFSVFATGADYSPLYLFAADSCPKSERKDYPQPNPRCVHVKTIFDGPYVWHLFDTGYKLLTTHQSPG